MFKKVICIVLLLGMMTSASATTYGIKVDTSKCKITIYEKVDGEWQKIGSRKCCVGASSSQTPKGNFTIYSKQSSFTIDEKDYNYVSYFSGKCAFHTVPCSNGKYDKSSLGFKRSHGCVRVDPETAEWIYKHCSNGTKVIIK